MKDFIINKNVPNCQNRLVDIWTLIRLYESKAQSVEFSDQEIEAMRPIIRKGEEIKQEYIKELRKKQK